jgi:hypothetical protein
MHTLALRSPRALKKSRVRLDACAAARVRASNGGDVGDHRAASLMRAQRSSIPSGFVYRLARGLTLLRDNLREVWLATALSLY